jgi:hypothetical protein
MALCFMMRPLRAAFFATASLEKTDSSFEFATLKFALSPCKSEIMTKIQGRRSRTSTRTKSRTSAVANHI